MKKYSIVALIFIMVLGLSACDLFNKQTASTTSTTTKEEYLDTTLSKNILLQTYDNTDKQTDVSFTFFVTNKKTYYDKDYNVQEDVDEYSLSFSKTGIGDNTIIHYDINESYDTETYFSKIWIFIKDGLFYTAMDYDGEKIFCVYDKNEGKMIMDDYTPSRFISWQYNLPDLIDMEKSSFTGKKISKGKNTEYLFKLLKNTEDETTTLEVSTKDDLITSMSFNRSFYENGEKNIITATVSFTYGINEIELPNLNEFKLEEY